MNPTPQTTLDKTDNSMILDILTNTSPHLTETTIATTASKTSQQFPTAPCLLLDDRGRLATNSSTSTFDHKPDTTVQIMSDNISSDEEDGASAALPKDFCPTVFTVIVGKGKIARMSPGNQRLRELVQRNLADYSKAKDKRTKSNIVNQIISAIQDSDGGLFVKRGKGDNPRFFPVKDAFAREKVGYMFRDFLSDKYRSSSKSKVARRQQQLFGDATMNLDGAISSMYPHHDAEAATPTQFSSRAFLFLDEMNSTNPTITIPLLDNQQPAVLDDQTFDPIPINLARSQSYPLLGTQSFASIQQVSTSGGAIPHSTRRTTISTMDRNSSSIWQAGHLALDATAITAANTEALEPMPLDQALCSNTRQQELCFVAANDLRCLFESSIFSDDE